MNVVVVIATRRTAPKYFDKQKFGLAEVRIVLVIQPAPEEFAGALEF